MATAIPPVAEGDPMSAAWSDIVETALAEAQALLQTVGPAAITISAANWLNYGGIHADAQVMRFGDIVFSVGLIKNNTGAAVAPPTGTLMTIPSGYRPRSGGTPVGGTVMFSNCCSGTGGVGRTDIGTGGSIAYGGTAGSVSIANGGFASVVGAWAAA